jgi:tetratricopeptide (TPR) repeat protein
MRRNGRLPGAARRALAAAVIAAGLAGTAAAEPAPVRALPLPTRRSPEALRARVDAVAAALARRLGAAVASHLRGEDAALARGRELAARGDLDGAARALDPALDAAAEAPHRVGDPALLVAAHVARASIALARGEDRKADRVFERLLAYDPGFALADGERSPRASAALAAARQRLATIPELRVALLGDSCSEGVLVVGRVLASGSIELTRFDGCRRVARVVAAGSESTAELAAALDVIAEPPPPPPPIWRRRGFWIGAAATVAVAVGGVVFFATRDDPELTITPRF